MFRGARFGDELAAHYACADVFVFPSLTDTFGLVILEGYGMTETASTTTFNLSAAAVEAEIAETDAAINTLVYELYGLTAEEQQLVERSLRS